MRSERILIHWLDRELGHYGRLEEHTRPDVLEVALRQTLILSLAAARVGVVIPAASLFENPRVPTLLEHAAPFREAGRLLFAGADPTAEDFVEAKRESYRRQPDRHPPYFDGQGARLARLIAPHWRVKQSSSSRAIAAGWERSATCRDEPWLRILEFTGDGQDAARALARVPELLDGSAFIADFAAEVFEREAGMRAGEEARARMNDLISRTYVDSYASDFRAAVTSDLSFLDTDRYLTSSVERLSLARLRIGLQHAGVLDQLWEVPTEQLLGLLEERSVRATLDDIAVRATRPGALFTVAEVKALGRRGQPRWPPRLSRSPRARLSSRASRYVELASRASSSTATIVNTFNFGDYNTFTGTINFGGTQYVVSRSEDVLEAAAAISEALIASDEPLDALLALDAQVTKAGSVDPDRIAEAVRPALERAGRSRRRELAERLATTAGGGLVVQGILALIQALGG